MTNSLEGIQAVADAPDWHYPDVHGNVQVLAKHHIAYFDTNGRVTRPVISYDCIRIDIGVAGDPTGEPASV